MPNLLAAKFIELVKEFSNTIVMQDGANRYSYQDLYQQALTIANTLQKTHQINAGDRVAIIMENSPAWVMTYFGIMLAEAVAVPLDPKATKDDLQYCLKNSGSKVVFDPKPRILPTTAKTTAKNIASILYTSGTTGKPKGVMLTHENFLANFQSLAAVKIISPKDNVLSLLPLHHVFPFMVNLIVPLFSRCLITYIADLSSETVLTCIRETGVTILVGVPQLYYMLQNKIKERIPRFPWLKRILFRRVVGKQLRLLVCGGAKLDIETAKFFTKLGFTFLEGYGLTETAPVVTFNSPKNLKIGSVGKPMPNVKVRIINPDQHGIGEVAIKGPNVMLGYYKMPKATKEALKDNWFYSGDLGCLDKAGFLYIVGRKKELIVLSSGKNIAPEEVEKHYGTNPFIKELCVLAVKDKLMAVIVPNLEQFRKIGEVNVYGAIKWNLENLSYNYPAYKRIMGFVVAKTELPRTRLGKLKRFLIQELYINELLGKPKKTKTSLSGITTTGKKVINILVAQTNKAINLTDHLELDLGLDSLSRVELMANLNRTFQINIPNEIAAKIFTVQELIAEIETLLKKPTSKQIPATSWAEILRQEPKITKTGKLNLTPGWLIKAILKIFWRVKAIGTENLPTDRPFIICANHNSYLDGLVIAAALPKTLRQKTFFLGYSNYFAKPILRNMVKLLNIIPTDPALHLIDAMQASAYVLRHHKIIAIFPEGERSIDGKVKDFKKGIGILAKELDMDIVPVYIEGSFEAWPRGKKIPKPHPIKITFGKPQKAKALLQIGKKQGAKDDYEAITIAIRDVVIKLP